MLLGQGLVVPLPRNSNILFTAFLRSSFCNHQQDNFQENDNNRLWLQMQQSSRSLINETNLWHVGLWRAGIFRIDGHLVGCFNVNKSYFDISNVYNMIRLLRSANHEDLVICVKPWWIGRLPKDQKCCLIPEPNNEPKEKRNIFDVKISLFFWCFSDLPGVFGFVVKLVEIYAWLSLFWYTCVAIDSSL